MEGFGKNNFENPWKDVFEGAEVSPSESVWKDMEQKLDNKAMKRRVIFYQRLVAACVLFALVAVSVGVYQWRENNKQTKNFAQLKNDLKNELHIGKSDSVQLKKNNEQNTSNKNEEKKGNSGSYQKGKSNQKQTGERLNQRTEIDSQSIIDNVNKDSSAKKSQNDLSNKTLVTKAEQTQPTERLIKSNNNTPNQSTFVIDINSSTTRQEKSISSNYVVENESSLNQKDVFTSVDKQSNFLQALQDQGNIDSQKLTVDLNIPELGSLPIDSIKSELVYIQQVRRLPIISSLLLDSNTKRKVNYEKVWVAVTTSEGSYAVNSNVSSYYVPSSSSYITTASSTSRGLTYTAGVLGGVRFASRWVLQAGLQYINQSSGYTSNIYANSLSTVANSSQYSLSSTSPYGITSTNEFVSVPMQVGYLLLLSGKFGVQINSGAASNFFVRNTLSDPSGQRKSYSQGAGENSPYRSVNFTGLLNSELSYRFGKNYRLSFVPGLGYSFNSIMKTQTMNNPLSWDVGLRLRYIFR